MDSCRKFKTHSVRSDVVFSFSKLYAKTRERTFARAHRRENIIENPILIGSDNQKLEVSKVGISTYRGTLKVGTG